MHDEISCESALTGKISALYIESVHDDTQLIDGMNSLASEYGNQAYRDLFFMITGKNLGSVQSATAWHDILQHRAIFIAPEYQSVGLRPAMFDYLHRVTGEIETPRFIDSSFLENIMRTSVTDGLTGLFNQTHFKSRLEKMIDQGRRSQDSIFSLILLDLDHFKQYNDSCGHLCGDEAIRSTARIIRESVRECDIACRYGGEEFAVLLPSIDMTSAHQIADRIRIKIEKEMFPRQDRMPAGNLTISGGISQYPFHGVDATSIIDHADTELYKAKSVRNCIAPHCSEMRTSARHPLKSLVEYATIEGSLYRPAMSINVSDCGIAIGCESFFPEGTVISLRLTRPFWPDSVQIEATVRQSKHQGDLVFVGLEFKEPLPGLFVKTASDHANAPGSSPSPPMAIAA